jgi:3-keto-5-aminohexanoate cleavage enzyme
MPPDNIRISKDRLAASNAERVQYAAAAAERHNRRPATPAEARAALGLGAAS